MLDRQVAAGGGVERERDVPGGIDALRARAHVLVHDDPAVPDLEPGRLGQARARLDAGAHQGQVGRVLGELLDGLSQPQRDAERFQPALDAAARLLSQPGGLRDVLVADERDVDAAHGERGGRFAADEARAHDERGLGGRRTVAQDARRGEAAQEQHPLLRRAGDGQDGRFGPGREHAGVVAERLARAERDGVRARIEGRDLAAEPHLHALVLVPGSVLDRQLGLVELAAQEVLRQRRALVGDDELRREQRDVAVATRGAVAARGGERGRAAADDQQLHASNRSRAYFGVHAMWVGVPKRARRCSWISSPVKGYRSVGPRQCTAMSVPRIRSSVACNAGGSR
jgi:hypothetical protein